MANKETVQEKDHLHTKQERLAAELAEVEDEKSALREQWQQMQHIQIKTSAELAKSAIARAADETYMTE